MQTTLKFVINISILFQANILSKHFFSCLSLSVIVIVTKIRSWSNFFEKSQIVIILSLVIYMNSVATTQS